MTLFEALTGGAFDRLNWKQSGEFDQIFKKVKCPRVYPRGGGGAWAVLELTGTLHAKHQTETCIVPVSIHQMLAAFFVISPLHSQQHLSHSLKN